jgi:hypothetical protein
MTSPPTMYTSPAQLDGTVTGMIVTVIVAALGLAVLIGMVFWAASHPQVRQPPGSPRRRDAPGPARPGQAVRASYEVRPAAGHDQPGPSEAV